MAKLVAKRNVLKILLVHLRFEVEHEDMVHSCVIFSLQLFLTLVGI